MPAPTANKNAEKWTLERTLETLRRIETYSYNSDCLYLGHALSYANVYSDVWAYWKRKWRKEYDIITRMKQIMQRFEVRLFDKMAKKEIPHQVAMFALKHHYGWGKEPKDDQPVDLSYEDIEVIRDEPTVTAPQPEATDTRMAETNTKATGTPNADSEFNKLTVMLYNEKHPSQPILTPAIWYHGTPPADGSAIPFDCGYFIQI